MEAAIPYLIGGLGLVIAVAGVFKGALDKSELRLELAYSSVEECHDELAKCREENRRKDERIEWLRELVARYAPASVNVAIGDVMRTGTKIVAGADVKIGGDLVGGDSVKRDETRVRGGDE